MTSTTVPSSDGVDIPLPRGTLAFDCYPERSGPEVKLHAADTFCFGRPGHERRRIVSPAMAEQPGVTSSPSWSPDGTRLLFRIASACEGLQCEAAFGGQADDIGLVNTDGSGFINLTNRPGDANWGPAWSPDGRWIVFNSAREQAPHLRLWVMRADGSHLRRITSIWGEYPFWSPDGRLIAFMSNRCACNGVNGEGEYDIYTVRPNGTRLRRLTRLPGEEGVGSWSPDGREIAFSRNPDVWPGIWLMSRTGGHVRHLEPRAPGGISLRGVGEWREDGFLIGALLGDDPQVSTNAIYWVPADGTAAIGLFDEASGGSWRPDASARDVSRLTIAATPSDGGKVRIAGRLMVGGVAARHRLVELGLLGGTIPTRIAALTRTGADGTFHATVRASSATRFVTAYFAGDRDTWSAAAFATARA